MDELIEEEENVFEQTTSAALHRDEDANEATAVACNAGAPDEIDEHADEGPGSSHYSEAFDDVSQLSPSRDMPDDEIHCANCSNYRDNSVRAFDAATNVSKLQAQYNKIHNKYEELCKNNASASILVEDTYNKLRETEVHRDSLQGELNMAASEIQRLQELNKQYLEAARLTDKHRQAADSWRNKYIQSQAILLDKSQKYDALEEKYRNSVDIVKTTLGTSNENAKKLLNLQDKLAQRTSDNRAMKKSWNPVVRLIADISSQLSELLPDGFRERLNRLPMDELLQIVKPPDARGAENSDDDDAEAIHRLMNADSVDAQTSAHISSPLSGARSRGGNRVSRGGRAQSMSTRRGGNKIVDETMHEKLLSRKLHKDDTQHNTVSLSNPSAKSIMGKKTESVREQQERQKAGLKDKIAELKKNAATTNEQSKGTILCESDHEDSMLMSDDEAANSVAVNSTSLGFDLDMPDFGDLDVNNTDGVEEISVPVGTSAVHQALSVDTASVSTMSGQLTKSGVFSHQDGIAIKEDVRNTDNTSEVTVPMLVDNENGTMEKSPSPAKMIKHPKVVELSQDRATMDLRCGEISSKRDQRRQESLTALGMDMSDSDDSGDENDKRTDLTAQSQPVLSRKIHKSEAVSTHAIPSSIEQISTPPTSIQPVGASLIDDILSDAHQKSTLENIVVMKNTLSLPENSQINALNKEEMSSMPSVGDAMEKAEEPRILLRRSTRARSYVLSPSSSSSQKRRIEHNERSDGKRNCSPAKIAMANMESDRIEPSESSPVCRRTRSKSIVGDETEPLNVETPRKNTNITSLHSSSRKLRSTTGFPSSTIIRGPSSSTKAEAVPRKERQGAQQIGAVKQAAARLRDEHARKRATLPDSAYPTGFPKRLPKVAAPDDVTPFSRNSRRTVVAAPRARAPAISPSTRERKVHHDGCDDNFRLGEASSFEDSIPEPVRNDETSIMSGLIRKRIARMGSASDLPITQSAVTAQSTSCGTEEEFEPASLLDLIQMSSDDDDENEQLKIDEHYEKGYAPPTPIIPLPASTMEGEVRSLITSPSTLPNSQPLCEISGKEEIQRDDVVLNKGNDSVAAHKSIKKHQEKDETEPGSYVADDAEDKEEMSRERFEKTSASLRNDEEGDLMIDSGPSSPAITPPPPFSPIISTTMHAAPLDNLSQKMDKASIMPVEINCPLDPNESSIDSMNEVEAHSIKMATVIQSSHDSTPTTLSSYAGSPTDKGYLLKPSSGSLMLGRSRLETTKSDTSMKQQGAHVSASNFTSKKSSMSELSAGLSKTSMVPSVPVPPPILPASQPPRTQSLEEKRRNAIIALNANRVRSTTRGGRGGVPKPGGEMQTRGTSSTRLSTISGNASRTSAMEAQMTKMSKNLHRGKLAMSGKMRQIQPVSAVPVRTDITINNPLPALPSHQERPDSSAKGVVETATIAKAIPENKIGEQRPMKRKANAISSVDAVAIRGTDVRTRGQAVAVTVSASAAATGNGAESRLITSVLNVCRDEESVEKAIQHMDISMLRVETIVKCICRALMELPQSNTWHVVRANMGMKIETIDRNKVIPKAERNLFDLLMKMHENGNLMMRALFDIFFETYSRVVLRSICSSNTTADVTRNVRCLFFALVLTDRPEDEKMDEGRKLFHQILQKKSSQAVCQSLVYLLWQKDTASLVSEILRTELNDYTNGGRLISMHMNAKKDAEVLYWSIEQFANNSCKNLSTAAFRTPATLEMVQSWWASDMKSVETIKEKSDSIGYTSAGALKIDKFYKELMVRMPVLISPQLRVDGLDRVKLLEQLDMPALDAVDRATANRIEDTGRVSIFTDTSAVSRAFLEEGEARVAVLKIHIAMAALTSFYTDRMYEADQREALRLHLALSIERVRTILLRPSADLSSCSVVPENFLSMGVRALMKWRDVVQRLTQNDLMCVPINISANLTPANKRPRCEDNDAVDQTRG